jgi:flagellar hook-associated protein 3 FlgL
MRPVEATWYRDFLFNLTNTKTRFDDAITQAGSGKKLNHLSDNPADMAYVLTLRSKIGQIDQFERNIQSGKMFLQTSESALNQVMNSMYTIVGLAEQGASEQNGPNERQILSDRIEQIRDEIMNYANSEVNGKYVFAGAYTDTLPFTKAADTVLPSGAIEPGDITYNGDGSNIAIQADFSITVDSNIPGNQVFTGPFDMFDRLQDLIVALREDNTPAIAQEIGNFNELIDQVAGAMGTIGNRTNHLNQIEGLLKNFKTSLVDKMSSLEDADMAEAISNIGREEVGLQAILQVGARINRTSLMNFLS